MEGQVKWYYFWFNMTKSKHANNKTKDVCFESRPYTKNRGHNNLCRKMYSINFTIANKTSLHYKGDDSYFLLMTKKSLNLRPKTKG